VKLFDKQRALDSLLIAPEGIEILFLQCVNIGDNNLLIAPEGIEIQIPF